MYCIFVYLFKVSATILCNICTLFFSFVLFWFVLLLFNKIYKNMHFFKKMFFNTDIISITRIILIILYKSVSYYIIILCDEW